MPEYEHGSIINNKSLLSCSSFLQLSDKDASSTAFSLVQPLLQPFTDRKS